MSWTCGTASFGEHTIKGEVCVFRATIADLQSGSDRVRAIVDEQAADPALWVMARTSMEAHLQRELRRLHVAIDGAPHSAGRIR